MGFFEVLVVRAVAPQASHPDRWSEGKGLWNYEGVSGWRLEASWGPRHLRGDGRWVEGVTRVLSFAWRGLALSALQA